MKSAYTLAHELYSLFAFAPKLPPDILYLVVQFSSFETRAILVRCSTWLYAIGIPFLFQEIRLYKPIQLTRLCKNKKALDMLGRTEAIFIEEGLFCPRADVTKHITYILERTTSLLRLQLLEIDPITRILRRCEDPKLKKLRQLASNPEFLPKLQIIVGTSYLSLDFLCLPIRSIKFTCLLSVHGQMHVELYPGLELSPESQPAYPTYSSSGYILSPRNMGVSTRGEKGTSLKRLPPITIVIRFPEEIRFESPLPIQTLLSGLTKLVHAAGLSSDGLRSIYIKFNPPLPDLSPSAQFTVVTELHKLVPELLLVRISTPDLIWVMSQPKHRQPQDTFPAWVPVAESTIPQSIDWWLDQLSLTSSKSTRDKRHAERAAERLHESIALRHPSSIIPSQEFFVKYIMGSGN